MTRSPMYLTFRLFQIGFLALFAGSCTLISDDDSFNESSGMLRTDREVYRARLTSEPYRRVEFDIPTVFTNLTGREVYLTGCRRPTPADLQKWENGTWIPAVEQVQPLCQSPPWTVAPGQMFRDTLHVSGFLIDPDQTMNAGPTYDVAVEGEYRLIRSIFYDPSGSVLLPESIRTSNTFRVIPGS